MARKAKKVGVASAKFTTTTFYILTCNFILVHGISIIFIFFKYCTFIFVSATSNVLWHSKKSNYVFPKTRNIHHLYWKIVCGSHTDTTVIFIPHHIHTLFNLVPRVCLFAGYVVITREQAYSGNEIARYSTFRQNWVMVSCLLLKLEPFKFVVFSK